MRHGTRAGADWHYRQGEKPCDPCRLAQNARKRDWYAGRRSSGPRLWDGATPARVLDLLESLGGWWTAADIADRLGVSLPTVHRAVQRLCGRGLLVRRDDPRAVNGRKQFRFEG